MGLKDRDSAASLDATTGMHVPSITGLIAGEDIDPAAPCYIKAADGLVYMANATAADEKAVLAGFSPRSAKAGQPITLFGVGARFHYDSAGDLTPGELLYIGATKGRLDTDFTVGCETPVARAITTTDIQVVAMVTVPPGLES